MHQGKSFADRISSSRRAAVPHAILDKIQEFFDGASSGSAPVARGGGGKKNVVMVGVCSKTGDFITRELSKAYSVTAFCVEEMGEKVMDDNGPLSTAPVKFLGSDGVVAADSVVVAFDDPPAVDAVKNLMTACKDAGVGHVVFLSRLGATKSSFGNKWGPLEDAAIKAFGEEGLSILRVGGPLEGGPFYAREIDTIKWSSAQAIMGYKNYQVAAGDELSQGGVGSARGAAAAGVAALLRRGPEASLASFSLTSGTVSADAPATTAAELDAMLTEAAGEVVPSSQSSSGVKAQLQVDFDDAKLLELTLPQAAAGPNIVDLLFNSPPAVSGSYWGVIILFVYGTYVTTTEDYVAKTGIDYWEFLK
jgi:hypothetical protein